MRKRPRRILKRSFCRRIVQIRIVWVRIHEFDLPQTILRIRQFAHVIQLWIVFIHLFVVVFCVVVGIRSEVGFELFDANAWRDIPIGMEDDFVDLRRL